MKKQEEDKEVLDKKFNVNFYEQMILNEEIAHLGPAEKAKFLKEYQDKQKKAYESKKEQNIITKDFEKNLRQNQISDLLAFKRKHYQLMSKLQCISEKRKKPKYQGLDKICSENDIQESQQNQRVLSSLVNEVKSFQKKLIDNGIDDSVFDEEQYNETVKLIGILEKEEKEIEEKLQLQEKSKPRYLGGKGKIKRISMVGHQEKFLATHLMDQSWLQAQDKNKFQSQELMKSLYRNFIHLKAIKERGMAKPLKTLRANLTNERLRANWDKKMQIEDIAKRLNISKEFDEDSLDQIIQSARGQNNSVIQTRSSILQGKRYDEKAINICADKIGKIYKIKDIVEQCNSSLDQDQDCSQYSILLSRMEALVDSKRSKSNFR